MYSEMYDWSFIFFWKHMTNGDLALVEIALLITQNNSNSPKYNLTLNC